MGRFLGRMLFSDSNCHLVRLYDAWRRHSENRESLPPVETLQWLSRRPPARKLARMHFYAYQPSLTTFLPPACPLVGLRASEMRCVVLLNWLVFCVAVATSAGSEPTPRIALDVGHSIKHPGADSARGVGEYYFNRAIAAALLRSLKESVRANLSTPLHPDLLFSAQSGRNLLL